MAESKVTIGFGREAQVGLEVVAKTVDRKLAFGTIRAVHAAKVDEKGVVNGTPVIRGTVRLQRVGLWIADLSVDQGSQISGKVQISIDGGLSLHGTAARTGVFMESAILRVVAGAGGFAKMVPPKFYRGIPAKQIFDDILRAGGESLSAASDGAPLSRQIDYCQIEEPVGDAFAALCDQLGIIWRARPDGTIWVGRESWPEVKAPGESISQDPHTLSETWGVEAPALLPGSVVGGRKVSAVEHQMTDAVIRTVVFYDRDDAADNSEDRQTRALRAIVERHTAHYDFLGEFRAKVVKQADDGTLEVKPENPRVPGMTKVPIRNGLPGVEVKVAAGAYVLVRFEDGDPGRPSAGLFDPGSLKELKITAAGPISLDAGSGDVAVKGGTVNIEGATAIKLGGSAAALAVVLDGDTAGPYPVKAKGTLIKGRV